jgi:hypothetical protein
MQPVNAEWLMRAQIQCWVASLSPLHRLSATVLVTEWGRAPLELGLKLILNVHFSDRKSLKVNWIVLME